MIFWESKDSQRSSPGSSVHGILQARILEWIAIPFSRDLPDPGIEPESPTLQADCLPSMPPGKPSFSRRETGKSLAGQWLGFCIFTAEGPSSIPGQRTKILQDARCNRNKKERHTHTVELQSNKPSLAAESCWPLGAGTGSEGAAVSRDRPDSIDDCRPLS